MLSKEFTFAWFLAIQLLTFLGDPYRQLAVRVRRRCNNHCVHIARRDQRVDGVLRLKSVKPKEMNFERKTFGEHDKRCRLVQRLAQGEAAKQLGISPATILNWETGKTEPSVKSMPAILRWLGYDPYLECKTRP